jgi:hypothetical protein
MATLDILKEGERPQEDERAANPFATSALREVLYQLLTGELPFPGNTSMLLHQVLNQEQIHRLWR